MPRPKKAKASKPRAIVSLDHANDDAGAERLRESRAEAIRIKSSGGTVNIDPRTGLIVGAWRKDCFTALMDRTPEHGAARWFEELIRTASGEAGQERPLDFIRASSEGAPGQNVTDAMIEAGELVETIEESLRPWEAKLLYELMKADNALLTRWRGVTLTVTGVTDPMAQSERLRLACSSLLWVRDSLPRLLRERRERKQRAAA